MATTRKNCGKKLKAAQTFAQYGSTAAGATGFAMDVAGICIPIPQPIKIGISAFIGALFGCFGGCYEYHKTPAEEYPQLTEIKNELGAIRHDIEECKDTPRRASLTLFDDPTESPYFQLGAAPREEKMEDVPLDPRRVLIR